MTPHIQEIIWIRQLRRIKGTKKATGKESHLKRITNTVDNRALGQVFKGSVKDYRDNKR